MGELWDDAVEGSKQIGEALGISGATGDSRKTKRRRREAMEAARPRRPSTVDDAQRTQIESDRLRKRQGVLANIYGGAKPTAPSVGVKTLLGS